MRTAAAPRALVRTVLQGPRPVIACILALLALTAALLPAALSATQSGSGPPLPWWALALAFAAVEMCVIHVQVRRDASSVSLSELPLVAALFFASPAALVVGRLVGVVTVLFFVRRQAPLKLAYNAALTLANVGVALTVFAMFDAPTLDVGVYV